MSRTFFRALLALGMSLSLGLSSITATAQEAWPARPIKLVVPYASGGTTDLIARRLAEQLSKELGQSIVVENRAGAGTNVGASAVAASKNDGYTLLLGSIFQVLNPLFGPEPNFDLFTGLEPISLVANMPFVLAANPKTPYNSGAELIAAAKAAPKQLSVSHAQLDLPLELLASKAGMQLLLVPYKGGGPATTDAIGGQVNMVFALVPVLLPHIQSGKLKPLAVTSAKRFVTLPNVSTFAESGFDYDMSMWYGLFAPAGTPRSIVERLARSTHKVMDNKEMTDWARSIGTDAVTNTPEEFRAQLRKETIFWQSVAKDMPHLMKKQ